MRYFLIFLFAIILISPQITHAQSQSFSFSLTPSEVEVISSRDRTVPLSYVLTNTGDPTVITVKAYRLIVADSQGDYQLVPYDDSLIDFPRLTTSASVPGAVPDENSIFLGKPLLMNAQEAIEFELLVEIESNISERDFYIALVAESVPSSGFSDTNNVFLQGGVGSLVYISVAEGGMRTQKGSIALFDVKSPFSLSWGKTQYRLFDSFQKVPLVVRIANQGDRVFRSSGQLLVTHLGAPQPQSIELQEASILAGSQRNLIATAKESYPIQKKDETILLPGSFAGITTIHSYVRIGDKSSQETASLSYITFPFRATLVALGAICISALGLLLIKYVKRVKK